MSNPSPEFQLFTLAQIGAKPTEGPSAGAPPATTIAAPGSAGATPTPPPPSGLGSLGMMPLLMVALFLAVMIIPQLLAGKKEKKRKEALLASIGKGDRVLTIGGQIGIVDQVRDQEVVLRIDENSNVKARFTKASIQTVLDSLSKPAAASEGVPTIEVKAKSDNPLPAR